MSGKQLSALGNLASSLIRSRPALVWCAAALMILVWGLGVALIVTPAAESTEQVASGRRLSVAAGFGDSESQPPAAPTDQPVAVAPDPSNPAAVPPTGDPKARTDPLAARGNPDPSPPRTMESKWFDVGGCTRTLDHTDLASGMPVTFAYQGTKATLHCGILPVNNIDEAITLELSGSPVPGRFDPTTVRPGAGGHAVPNSPAGTTLVLGNIVFSTLTLDTEYLPVGSYSFEVTGTSVSYSHRRTVTLTILPAPAPSPVVQDPDSSPGPAADGGAGEG